MPGTDRDCGPQRRGAFRWIRTTDFPLLDAHGLVQPIGGTAQDVTDTKLAAEHRNVLLFELQHRVRNILAKILSIADRTGDTADSVDGYRGRMEGRLRALARVQVLLTRTANVGVDLATLIRDEVEAQAEHAGQFILDGPDILLSPKAEEVLTLAVHELATNALEHGALAHPAGSLTVAWRIAYEADEPWLQLDWREADLSGYRVLVVEDGFYLAADTERALRRAEADVLGPVGREELALELVCGEDVTCALIDINLGDGAQFRVANTLMGRGVPLVFITGYDDVMIPSGSARSSVCASRSISDRSSEPPPSCVTPHHERPPTSESADICFRACRPVTERLGRPEADGPLPAVRFSGPDWPVRVERGRSAFPTEQA